MEMMNMVMSALIIGILPLMGFLLWWFNDLWYAARLSSSNNKLPPGHMGLPYFGELFSFLWYFKILGCPDDYLNSKRQRYGDGVGLYRTHLFGSPSVIAYTPEAIKYLMRSESEFTIGLSSELIGMTSFSAAQGKAHTRLKSFITRAINMPQSLRHIAIMVQPRIISALQSWSDQGTIVAHKEAKRVTFENIGSFFASLQPGPALETLDNLFTGILGGFRASPINFPGTAYHHALQCREKATRIFRKELEKKKKKISEGVNNISVNDTTNDLMDRFMSLKDDEGKEMSDAEVLDNIINLVFAGYESTALSITWALYYLAKYPIVLHKLREENMYLRKHKNEELITSDDVAKLSYTNKVVEETLRLANVASFIYRVATKDVEYKGYTIPKGWKVMMWVRYLHTNPENFEDPMSFNPDRWSEPAKAGTYKVFGGGSRICAGNMLARLQLALFLHHLAIGYKWELMNPDAKITYLSHPKPEDGAMLRFNKL